jgi:hypothetical protein
MQAKEDVEYDDESKSAKRNRKISFWVSIILSTVAAVWYFIATPPDTVEVKNMRLFFKNNVMEVTNFIKLTRDERNEYAEKKDHPFYKAYVKASETERKKINALIHISYDYTPNQYWFNIFFLWLIFITTFWFIGLMIEGAIILIHTEDEKRRAKLRKQGVVLKNDNAP